MPLHGGTIENKYKILDGVLNSKANNDLSEFSPTFNYIIIDIYAKTLPRQIFTVVKH